MKKPQASMLTTVLLTASILFLPIISVASGVENNELSKNYKENYKGTYKDETCPVGLVLKDGLYFGAAAGYDVYRVSTNVAINEITAFFSGDPALNVTGAVGGAFLGYGHYFSNFYNLYLGFEIFGNGSAAKTDYELALLNGGRYKTQVEINSNYGISVLPGIKLNQGTLFYIRLGYNWTDIDVSEKLFTPTLFIDELNQDTTRGGFNYGLGIEGAFYNNWSARLEFSHTDYSDFNTDFGTNVDPADNQLMLGLIYHFD